MITTITTKASRSNLPARDHELLNHVIFTEAQAARIESERPVDGVPIATRSGYELAAYRMPNGSRFVTLFDASEAVWEAYCKELMTMTPDEMSDALREQAAKTRQPYQPKTGQPCGCKRGVMRDNCGTCEGTGWVIDFVAIRAKRATQ